MDPPHIACFVQSQPQQPDFFELPERDATDHPRFYTRSRGEALQLNGGSGADWARRAHRASAKVSQDYDAWLRELIARIYARDSNRNFAGNTSTSPRHFSLW